MERVFTGIELTSLSTAGQYRQTCSKLIQFGLKKLVPIFCSHSTDLV